MPTQPLRPCLQSGCAALVRSGSRCPLHQLPERPRRLGSREGLGWAWQKTRAAFLKANPWCSCGCGQLAVDVDHIIPREMGGTDDWCNLQGFTHGHHSRKTASRDGGYGNARG